MSTLKSTATKATATNKTSGQATRDLKSLLLGGAAVTFASNGTEMVYTIEGVTGLEVSAQGYIIDKGDVKYPKQSNDSIYITARTGMAAINIAYKSLILLLNGYIPKGGFIVTTRDAAKGYSPDNLKLLSKFTHQEASLDLLERTGNHLTVAAAVPALVQDEDKTVIDPTTVYTSKVQVQEFFAEDGKSFESLELAAIHQRTVTAAKEVAQVVLDYNKGLYGVAEKAYLRVMQYEGKPPYVNFRDVMDNNNGVVEKAALEVVKFNKFRVGQEPLYAHLFSNKTYTQEVANEILDMLALAADVKHNLEMLSKRTVNV